MKHIITLFLLVLSLNSYAFSGMVTKVHDGDTVTVINENLVEEKIRVYRIDAPEIKYSNIPTQPYAFESRDSLSSLCLNKKASVTRKGVSYSRTVAIINCNGADAANWQLYHGNAWVYRYTSTKTLMSIQNSAKNRKAGLWAGLNPVEPYLWRRGVR